MILSFFIFSTDERQPQELVIKFHFLGFLYFLNQGKGRIPVDEALHSGAEDKPLCLNQHLREVEIKNFCGY